MENRIEENGAAVAVEQQQPPVEMNPSAIIKQMREEQIRRCADELNALMQRHSCALQAEASIRDGRIVTSVIIIPVN